MNRFPLFAVFIALLWPASFFAQGLTAPLAKSKAVSYDGQELSGMENWRENENERGVYSSSWTTPDGRVIIRYSSVPINYYNANGKLVPIDTKPHPQPYGQGWAATHQPYPTYLYANGALGVTVNNKEQFVFSSNSTVNGVWNSDDADWRFEENKIIMPSVAPGVNKEIEFRLNAIKYNYIVMQQQIANGNWFTIQEEMEIPQGCALERDLQEGRSEQDGWAGAYILRSVTGEVVGQIKAPVCYDAAGNWTIANYVLENNTGKAKLKIRLPYSWLNNASRVYPVTIDPLITGPTALWSNGMMPSCIAPAFNSDSILVTIPAQIAVTGLIITSSYYADPFTTATMSQGAMWFSTPCDTSQQFTITGSAGNSPGTAYLDTFNLRNPLMCCYPQACTTRTFLLYMHLSRTGPGVGCNTTYIRYDPTTTLWPFNAYVVGRTVESYSLGFTVQNTAICSDECNFTGRLYFRYGVPPYVVTHPWMVSDTFSIPQGCNFGLNNQTINFTIPNCPVYCDTSSTMSIPPPVITDACGNTVSGLVPRILNIKPTPALTASPNPDTICAGSPILIALSSCLPGSTITWSGNNSTGSGNITGIGNNSGTSDSTVMYTAQASVNGCQSLPITIPVVIDPEPVAAFTYSSPIIAGVPVTFTDQSSSGGGAFVNFIWNFGDSTRSGLQNPVTTYANPGVYTVCHYVYTINDCDDTICQTIEVIPAAVETPNVITPNADGINDQLVFKYLEFYPNNQLEIYDRWGVLIYQKESYSNDWNGNQYADGTYYYVLTVRDNSKVYTGFFQLIK
jgi:gliding motility-associated-like protein